MRGEPVSPVSVLAASGPPSSQAVLTRHPPSSLPCRDQPSTVCNKRPCTSAAHTYLLARFLWLGNVGAAELAGSFWPWASLWAAVKVLAGGSQLQPLGNGSAVAPSHGPDRLLSGSGLLLRDHHSAHSRFPPPSAEPSGSMCTMVEGLCFRTAAGGIKHVKFSETGRKF